MQVELSSRFKKLFRKLDRRVQTRAIERIKIFKENSFDARLETHKLHGKDLGLWSFSVDYFHRIKFIFIDRDKVLFLEIGRHNIYK
ncbi:MAG: type II toxin-antitoxin system mRNA interferase toxin, RelE/StbE family [Patescibacteria group bacterium]